jgi:hypothetical protein
MKNTIYKVTMLLFLTLGFQSCEDLEEVKDPNFNISFNQTVKVGEPVTFTVNNSPNFLNFFSGEDGSKYKFKDRVKAEGDFFVQFETARHYFDGASKSDNAWNFLVSTDYTGSGTIEDVKAATWTDLTDDFVFATARTYSPATNSGKVNITQFASEKPTYFAIKILAEGKKSEGNRQGVFRFYGFDTSLVLADTGAIIDVTNIDTPGFTPVNVQGTHPTIDTKDIWRDRGAYYEIAGDQAEYTNEDWLITNPVNLSGSVSPDKGTALKTYTGILKTFDYTFTKAGTYQIAFVGNNQTIHGQKGNVKEYTITVTD